MKRDQRIQQLEMDLDELTARTVKLAGRVARKRSDEAPAPTGDTKIRDGESDSDWKRRMRQRIAAGDLKHG